jgi:AmmeMemoRadiSam system protein A
VSEPLSLTARAELLRIARESVFAAARGLDYFPRSNGHPELDRGAGVFVTLRLRGRLRGCIGRVTPSDPLWRVVPEIARCSALEDPRFPPLAPHELDRVAIEISVLGPMRGVRGPEEIRPGLDGLLIRRAERSGLLLPQVAIEAGWDAVRFLEETCVKAGLPRGAWTLDAEIVAFTAEVFG